MDRTDEGAKPAELSLWLAWTPLLVLIGLLALSAHLFGSDSSYGPNQIGLLLAMAVAAGIGVARGLAWDEIQKAIVHGVGLATGALFILLAVGALIGAWILSGTVPTLVYYGLMLMDPAWFYPATCLVCALVALAVGSSWTVAGTLGVALMGVASGLGLSPAITAGAVISGAYFGDKMSPLSDTTNLAPAAAGSELFVHIRHMVWTTGPSFVIALAGFALLGMNGSADAPAGLDTLSSQLQAAFHPGLHLLLPLLLVLVLAMRKVPALPSIAFGALVGAVFAVIFQPAMTIAQAPEGDWSPALAMVAGAWKVMFAGYAAESGVAEVDQLLNRGGMAAMLNPVWLTMCGMAFGAVMERIGALERIVRAVLAAARSTASLIVATLLTAIGTNAAASDQYLAIVLPGRLFRPEYERRGLAPENLSRALEDAGTLTSPLVPWNACGAYMAATLGVATTAYLPFALFNLVNPLVAAVLAYAGFKITRRVVEAR